MSYVPHAYTKYELLFTPHLIPALGDLREQEWQGLVKSVANLPETHPDALAFSVMMINLSNCLTCEMDSYRAQRGCETCARHAVTSFKGTDSQLIQHFHESQDDVASQMKDLSL